MCETDQNIEAELNLLHEGIKQNHFYLGFGLQIKGKVINVYISSLIRTRIMFDVFLLLLLLTESLYL